MRFKSLAYVSSVSRGNIDFNQPRIIWVNLFQLLYTLLAMIPVTYYLREIVLIEEEGQFLLIGLPISIGVLLYFVQLRLNEYFWINEQYYKKRDILISSCKSAFLVIFVYYFVYFFLLGYWISTTEQYEALNLENQIGRILFDNAISLAVIVGITLLMVAVQKEKTNR